MGGGVGKIFRAAPQDLKWNSPHLEYASKIMGYHYFFVQEITPWCVWLSEMNLYVRKCHVFHYIYYVLLIGP